MTEGGGRELNDVIYTAVFGWWLAAFFGVVRQLRIIRDGDKVSAPKFLVGVFSSGAVGCLAAWVLDALEVDRSWSAAIISVTGYVGGPVLDKLYDWTLAELDAALEALAKWHGGGGVPPKI